MVNFDKLGLVGIVIGVTSIGYSIYVHRKVSKTEAIIEKSNKIIEASINAIAKDMSVDIPQAMIDMATEKAVEREVSKAVKTVSYEVSDGIRRDVSNKVRNSVDNEYANIRESVSKEVAKQVSNLDIDRLKRDVKEEAKRDVLKKFNENLDDLIKDFNQNLTNISKIYSSVAESMVKKPQETVFKLEL